jgi:hypothetical protein
MEPEMPTTKTPLLRNVMIGFLLGAAVGVPLSFFFQSGLVRASVGLGDYVMNFRNVWTRVETGMTARVSVILCGVAGAVVAGLVKSGTTAGPPAP